jgi:hypothetical protein
LSLADVGFFEFPLGHIFLLEKFVLCFLEILLCLGVSGKGFIA